MVGLSYMKIVPRRVLFDLTDCFSVHQLRIHDPAVFLYDNVQMITQLLIVDICSRFCYRILLCNLIALFHSNIGQALVDLILVLSPEKIILGGGVMHQEHMMPLVREEVRNQMAGYIKTKQMDDLDNYIVLPSLNDNQGIMGALKLAVDELELEK